MKTSAWRRLATVFVVVATMPLIMGGGGGFNPPPTGGLSKASYDAVVVMDPHAKAGEIPPGTTTPLASDVTTTAKQASIWLFDSSKHKGPTAGAVFGIPSTSGPGNFALFQGCVLQLAPNGEDAMAVRFINGPLTNWIPQAVVEKLFAEIGVTVSGILVIVTEVDDVVCTDDPNPANNIGVPGPGFLSFRAVLRIKSGP